MQTPSKAGLIAAIFLTSVSARAATIESFSGRLALKLVTGQTITLSGGESLPYQVSDGSRIETALESKARLLLDDGTEVSMAPGAELLVDSPSGRRDGQPALALLYGKIRALVRKRLTNDEPWNISVNNAIMGVRGTEFIIEANRDHVLLCTFEGAVEVELKGNASSRRLIEGGQGVLIASEGKISPPVTMEPRIMDYWRQQTMVDVSSSPGTRLRVLGNDWHWGPPTAVEYLDPNSSFSEYQMLNPGGAIWGRALKSGNVSTLGRERSNPDLSLTGRLALNASLVPTRYYLLYGEATATVKTGHANVEPAGVKLFQAFALFRSQSSHSLAVGRQEWDFGDGLIIGRDPWSPFSRSFDGVLGTLRSAPARVRLFASTLRDRKDKINIEDWMAGVYAEGSVLPLQLYGIWVKRGGPGNNIVSPNDLQTRHTILGERSELTPWGPFFINEEFAYELGTIGTGAAATQNLAASLLYADAGGTWHSGALSGLLKAVYLRASGDATPGTGSYGAFVQLMPDTHRFLGVINAFPQLRNIERIGATSAARYPLFGRPVTATLDYSLFRRVEINDPRVPAVTRGGERVLGQEVDLQLGYEPISQVLVQAGGGILATGQAYQLTPTTAYLAFLTAQLRF